ncbi:MAG: phytoene desaturase family protein [Peptostreptococcaceae bacterium]
MKNVIVVGAGIGGLCTAIRLLNKGYKVTILEKENTIGGKVNIKNKNGFRFDLTASVIMTPKSYTQIFKDVNKDYRNYFEMIKLDKLYKVNYFNKDSYEISSDIKSTITTLDKIDKNCGKEYLNLIATSMKKYLISKEYFLNKSMINKDEILKKEYIKKLRQLNPRLNSYKYICSKVKNEKLREYLLFKSMYIGINPYENSNIYTLIPAISQTYGLHYIKGGLYEYIKSLDKLIQELGGKIILNTFVEEILVEDNEIKGVRTKDKSYQADVVVCNADYPYAIDKLLKKEYGDLLYNKDNIKNKEYSCSVFMMYLGLNKKYENLNVNNIYISENFKDSIESSFEGRFPKCPSMYIYYPSAIDNTLCENKDHSVLNIMVRIPNLFYENIKWNENTVSFIRNKIINELKNIEGLENIEDNIIYEDYLTPKDLESKFNSYKGNAFGLSHKLSQTTYFRPHMKSSKVKNLYFIGSSTHPGNGVSVIIDGSKVLSELISK